MNILIYCPEPTARAGICQHLIDVGNFQLFFAETEELTVTIALRNEIRLVLIFDPAHISSLIHLKDYLREKRRHLRVRLLPSQNGNLTEGWRKVINDALQPVKKRPGLPLGTHARFQWKPQN